MTATIKPLRCLIVEDVEDDALLMLDQLHSGGYDVTWERVDTREAMRAALERQPWDIIISDYTMPHFSGLAALKLLHATGLDLPFIVVSGTIGEDTAVEMMKAGAHDYLMKGKPARLVPAVTRELHDAVARRESAQTTEALRTSEARLALALEMSQSGVWDFDMLTNTVDRTLLRDRIFGHEISLPSWTYDMFLEHVLPEDRAAVDRNFRHAVETLKTWNLEYRIRRADGKVRWIWAGGSFRFSPTGKVLRMIGIVRDVTGRKRAEEVLREHDAELCVRNETLTRFNGVAVGRELRMIELKREVNELCAKLGEPPRHRVARTKTTPVAELGTQT